MSADMFTWDDAAAGGPRASFAHVAPQRDPALSVRGRATEQFATPSECQPELPPARGTTERAQAGPVLAL